MEASLDDAEPPVNPSVYSPHSLSLIATVRLEGHYVQSRLSSQSRSGPDYGAANPMI